MLKEEEKDAGEEEVERENLTVISCNLAKLSTPFGLVTNSGSALLSASPDVANWCRSAISVKVVHVFVSHLVGKSSRDISVAPSLLDLLRSSSKIVRGGGEAVSSHSYL